RDFKQQRLRKIWTALGDHSAESLHHNERHADQYRSHDYDEWNNELRENLSWRECGRTVTYLAWQLAVLFRYGRQYRLPNQLRRICKSWSRISPGCGFPVCKFAVSG